jgi:hypothetical protein
LEEAIPTKPAAAEQQVCLQTAPPKSGQGIGAQVQLFAGNAGLRQALEQGLQCRLTFIEEQAFVARLCAEMAQLAIDRRAHGF